MNRSRMFAAFVALTTVCASLSAQTANPAGSGSHAVPPTPPGASPTGIWMGDNNLLSLANVSSDWDCTSKQIQVLKLYIGEVKAASQQELIALVQRLEQDDIKIAIELAGLMDTHADKGNQSGEQSFISTVLTIRKITDPISAGGAGGTVSFLEMDGPIRRMFWPNNTIPTTFTPHTLNSAADELVDVMRLWKRELPGVQISLLTNFPNWGWKGSPAYTNLGLTPNRFGYGDYYDVLRVVTSKALAANVPLVAITADNPYGYAMGTHPSNQSAIIAGINWMGRLLDLEAETHARGLEFHIIYNSELGGFTSDALFLSETMNYIDAYQAAGGQPEAAVIQSWYPFPQYLTPEDTSGTMTNVVLEAIKKIRPFIACP